MVEKRKSARVRVNAVVSFKVKTSRLVGGSRVKDISETGVCIPSKHFFPVDSILELDLRSDDLNEPIKILARVVRIHHRSKGKYQFEVGIEFIDMFPSKRNILHDYIQKAVEQGINQDISWMD